MHWYYIGFVLQYWYWKRQVLFILALQPPCAEQMDGCAKSLLNIPQLLNSFGILELFRITSICVVRRGRGVPKTLKNLISFNFLILNLLLYIMRIYFMFHQFIFMYNFSTFITSNTRVFLRYVSIEVDWVTEHLSTHRTRLVWPIFFVFS